MEFELFALLIAAGGGFFGAAIGGLPAFVFTGFMVIAGGVIAMLGGGMTFLDEIAFGPVVGPHVAFAGAVAAVAFAARRSTALAGDRIGSAIDVVDAAASSAPAAARASGTTSGASEPGTGYDAARPTTDDGEPLTPGGDPAVPGGKDIATPLVALERPTVLLIGAAAGMVGYTVERLVSAVPWFGENTDSVALTVLLLGLATRVVFGRTPLFARTTPRTWGDTGLNRFAPYGDAHWIRYHERLLPGTLLGLFVGLVAAGAALTIVQAFPAIGDEAPSLMFGVSAASLLFLALGKSFPVTHHISVVAGVAGVAFLPVFDGNTTAALLVGALAGMLAAWLGEFFARIWHNGGDTHVDPPAAAIWPMTTVALGLAALLG